MAQQGATEEVARAEQRDEQPGGPRRSRQQIGDGARVGELPEEVGEVAQGLVRVGGRGGFLQEAGRELLQLERSSGRERRLAPAREAGELGGGRLGVEEAQRAQRLQALGRLRLWIGGEGRSEER